MSTTTPTGILPAAMEEKLTQISRRQAAISLLRGMALGAIALCAAMSASMMIDWNAPLFDPAVRMTLTVTSLVLGIGCFAIAGLPALWNALRRLQAARNADAEIPQLEERWQTVVSLAGSARQPKSLKARAMLQQVTSEAVAIGRIVQPQRVADAAKLKTAAQGLACCLLFLAGFLAIDWSQTSVLLRRFWNPLTEISATSLHSSTGDVSIPRGEFLNLAVETTGLLRKSATLTIVHSDSKPESVVLSAEPKRTNLFSHRTLVDSSFRYRVRAGDGETAWHTVTVVDFPELAEVRFRVISPAYLHRPDIEKTVIPGRVKVMQGSTLQLEMRPKENLQRFDLMIADEGTSKADSVGRSEVRSLHPDADGWYRFKRQLMQGIQISPKLWNSHGLTNEDPIVCRVQVIADSAPVARVLNSLDEMSVASNDVIDIKFEAHDDHGIAKAELVIYDESAAKEGEPAPILKIIPIPLGDKSLEKFLIATMQLDLKQLDLKPGTQISYAVRVTDNRAVDTQEPSLESLEAQAAHSPSENTDGGQESSSRPSDKTDKAVASAKTAVPKERDVGSPNDGTDRNDDHSKTDSAESAAGSSESPLEKKIAAAGPSEKRSMKESSENAPQPGKGESDDSANPQDGNRTPRSKKQTSKEKDGPDTAKLDADRRMSKDDPDVADKELRKGTTGSSTKLPIKESSDDTPEPGEGASDDSANPPDGKRTVPSKKKTSKGKKDSANPQESESHNDDSARTGTPDDSTAKAEAKASRTSKDGDLSKEQMTDETTEPKDPAPSGDQTSEGDAEQDKEPNEPNSTSNKSGQPNSGKPRKSDKKPSVDSDDEPPADRMLAMAPQQSESGQNAETNRKKLKITERVSAASESRQARKNETSDVRERVVEIDSMLSEVETGLTRIVNRDIPDGDRSAQFKNLDTLLGTVETKISDLRNKTRDEEFAFIGLQMVDIGRSHVTPGRERVFVAIREPATAGDNNSRAALQQMVRARELLAALLSRYERIAREKQLAESLKESVKMYEIYVDKMQKLMREARQNQNPLERKMAVIEVGTDYLDRYAEVLAMRRDMMSEFGRLLGDDPRLLARYLDLVKRRRASLRDQLGELSKQQKEVSTELKNWLAADPAQRDDLWTVVVELRMQASRPLAKDGAELGERIERQLPLVLEANQGISADVVKLGKQITETSRAISLEARRQIRQPDGDIDLRPQAAQLVKLFVDLDAALEHLGFEKSKETDVTNYVTGRLLESRTVADQADSWKQIAGHVHGKRYAGLVEVDQHRIAIATELLRVDMLGIETELTGQFQQLAEKSIPAEIGSQIRELQRLMEEITFEQASATFALSEDQVQTAETLQKQVGENFARAEELFDKIRKAVAGALDEIAVPNPTVAELRDPRLDEFLTQLEREPNIEAQLGLPDRPRNLRIIADTMNAQETGGSFLNEAEEAAKGRMKQEMQEVVRKGKPDPKPTKKSADEPTEEEREQQQQAREVEEELAKTLAALRERKEEPEQDPAKTEKLEQAAKDLQEKLAQMKAEKEEEERWQQMEAELAETLESLKQRTADPATPPADRRKYEQATKDLQQTLDQMGKQTDREQRRKLVAEFERTKAVLKAVARGERIPDEQWNKLMSTLDEGVWQVGGRTLPAEFRKAIEQYQERIRRLTDGDDADR